MAMTALWRNFSGNVVANGNWNCLLISASEVPGLLADGAADSARLIGSARNACVAQQCLNENCPLMIEKKQWPPKTLQIWIPWRHHVCRATHNAVLKHSSETQNSFWIKSRTGTIFRKAVPSFSNLLTEYVKGDGRHFEHFSLLEKSVRTYGVCADLKSWHNFW